MKTLQFEQLLSPPSSPTTHPPSPTITHHHPTITHHPSLPNSPSNIFSILFFSFFFSISFLPRYRHGEVSAFSVAGQPLDSAQTRQDTEVSGIFARASCERLFVQPGGVKSKRNSRRLMLFCGRCFSDGANTTNVDFLWSVGITMGLESKLKSWFKFVLTPGCALG